MCTHVYPSPGEYKIQILSDNNYMPNFNFYNNYSTINNNSKKLIKINGKMYQTRLVNFQHCFRDCSNLISIPIGLFDNNINITSLNRLFHILFIFNFYS